MSVAQLLQPDQSEALAKRFAHLTWSYFDQPEIAQKPNAKIPIENLFRMLEMFRYEAFHDEPSGGIVSQEPIRDPRELHQQKEPWHTEIERALGEAVSGSFGKDVSRDDAIEQIQIALRWLANGENRPSEQIIATTRDFLRSFEEQLK